MVGLVVDIVVVVNESADWGEEGEINISPDNIVVIIHCFCLHFPYCLCCGWLLVDIVVVENENSDWGQEWSVNHLI